MGGLLFALGCAPPAPSLVLLAPEADSTVCGDPLEVRTEIEGFTLVGTEVESDEPATGHLHVFLNGQEVAHAGVEDVDIPDVEAQQYQLTVDLALANHEGLEPYVGTTIYITVDDAKCS